MSKLFTKFANAISGAAGSPFAFILCAIYVIAWACTGPFFGFSNTWQLVINSSTTIVTFLMVFLIQNTQNRDNGAIHAADNEYIGIEHLTDEELQKILRKVEQNAHHLHEEKGRRAAKGEKAAGRSSPRRAKTPAV